VEFLSEDPIPDMSLGSMVDEAINGSYSMNIIKRVENTLNGSEMADALLEHGSDPGFFHLTEDGEDANE